MSNGKPPHPDQTIVWAVVILAVSGVVGIIGLEAVASESSDTLLMVIVGFLAPTIAALLNRQTTQQVKAATDNANTKLDKIDHSLNGEFDGRIERIVERVIMRVNARREDSDDARATSSQQIDGT